MSIERSLMEMVEERRLLDRLYWGGVLILAGLAFAAESLGVLPQVGRASAWSWLFLAAGAYGLLGALFRLVSSSYSNPTAWDYIWSGGLLIIGLGDIFAVDLFWPAVLIIAGVAMLVKTLLAR